MAILVLLMFSSDASMTDKMMSTLKRGTLTCAVFFVLAIISGIGPNAAKGAKAFGALIIVAIMVQSDMSTVLTDLDGIIKNDWIGTTPSDSSGGTGDTGTKATAGSDVETAVEQAAEQTIQTVANPARDLQKVLGAIGIHIP